ncbi:hypothetical protein MLD38_026373 [Melastoma candidum]|uniref:Uncharacterized protein n=1 Tax=Melastoma candidum TaxID=119954 RepID=A0ACB9P1W0_9MYRT|nr:hypothetical protein MLD38_026373 [Melastoma candidum]
MHLVDALPSENHGDMPLHGLVQGDEHHVFKSFGDPDPKTTYDVAIFASDSWRKPLKNGKEKTEECSTKGSKQKQGISVVKAGSLDKDPDGASEDSGTDDNVGEMTDGILSNEPRESYELPSQDELIRQAFAGDDVEEDFEKDKLEILNEENPEPEKPVLVPGWGQWTHVQQKKGMPSWMQKEHEDAKKKREEALKKRKDANLENVIIAEKIGKKVEKLLTMGLPFPFTSKDVFEQSIRMLLGPDFNPATAIGALNRPEVVKKSGIIIKPIQFKEVDPHERANGGATGYQKVASSQKRKTGGKKSKMNKKVAKANKR